jgi:homoserine kinase
MDVEVRVPATVANLGPGFDCLGAAIGTYLRIKVGLADDDEVVGDVTPLPRNLTHAAFMEAFSAASKEAPAVRIEVVESYPSARGLGASASAIVAGLAAARHMGELKLTDSDLARLAIKIEGHSDNVLPALFGGLVLCAQEGWMRFEVSADIAPVVLIAGEKLKTSEARRILPLEVPRADAVSNSAATAGLVAVLTGLQPLDALPMATEDRLHEPYRLPLMRESFDIHTGLRAKGFAVALAGAGPSLICLVESSRVDEAVTAAKELLPEGWDLLTTGWDTDGAQVR